MVLVLMHDMLGSEINFTSEILNPHQFAAEILEMILPGSWHGPTHCYPQTLQSAQPYNQPPAP